MLSRFVSIHQIDGSKNTWYSLIYVYMTRTRPTDREEQCVSWSIVRVRQRQTYVHARTVASCRLHQSSRDPESKGWEKYLLGDISVCEVFQNSCWLRTHSGSVQGRSRRIRRYFINRAVGYVQRGTRVTAKQSASELEHSSWKGNSVKEAISLWGAHFWLAIFRPISFCFHRRRGGCVATYVGCVMRSFA